MDRSNQFSYEGLGLLFDYFEQYEEDTGVPFELDVIAICCEFSEASYEYICDNYGLDVECEDEDDLLEAQCYAAEKYLSENTIIVGSVDGCFIYQKF
jgi:hypothetical protein